MILKDENQVFNLMDTNGRRNDVINALQGYISILNDIQNIKMMKWDRIPNSLAQYEFYRQAIELSPDVFQQHGPYDELIELIRKESALFNAINDLDTKWINDNYLKYKSILDKFDSGIEDRARHYTNTLVKLGFTNKSREISLAGKSLLNSKNIKKDKFEKLLPIDGINIVYLRQLMKLQIFNGNKDTYYSPFNLALYILLKYEKISEKTFLEIIQGMNPYIDVENIDNLIENYLEGDILKNRKVKIPNEINTIKKLEKDVFKKYFKNKKSSQTIEVYWKYYDLIYLAYQTKEKNNLKILLDFYKANKDMLNKAFGKGKNIFSKNYEEINSVDEIFESNNRIKEENINVMLYKEFILSKLLDSIREYSDTTKRIFKATGIISFENGIVELKYKEVMSCLFEINEIFKRIVVKKNNYLDKKYIDEYFLNNNSIYQILQDNNYDINIIEKKLARNFSDISIDDIPNMMKNKRRKEFEKYIDEKYPLEKVKDILLLFNNRINDEKIKNIVSTNATVPTIYEYIVGIAWYYFSDKKIDIISSFNLTLSADFEPLVHAGGGKGDIVIYDNNMVIMLEATLMNANSQKRGEWEPVLRHSVNLKVEEEANGKDVITFFIADNFDQNTINIWKAIASVPLQSSTNKEQYTDNVTIMPISTNELIILLQKSHEYQKIINKICTSFKKEKSEFDINWREKIINNII